ncbi:MAG: hypothetical protein DRP06_00090 [Candidatus Aenigmatarchaeota archaeon]|nr:MAG: hypothetical protein DRP06_00090 [Candidatus Aenigmarchaeota archaeon]
MECLWVVDEQDVPVRKETREYCHENHLIHRGVLVGVRNPQGELYFKKRSPDKNLYPGMWEISVAGHVPYTECYKLAGMRELKEELGLESKSSELTRIAKFIDFNECEKMIDMLYLYKINNPEIKLNEEATEGRFFSYPEFCDLAKTGEIKVTIYTQIILKNYKDNLF